MGREDVRPEAEGELQFMRVSGPSQGIQGLPGAARGLVSATFRHLCQLSP